MKFPTNSIKKDPAFFFFTLFAVLSFISTLAGQISLVLSLVFTLANKDERRRFRLTWPTWGWLIYIVIAIAISGVMAAANSDELLNPRRGFGKIFEHLLWYIAIPVVSAQASSPERFGKALRAVSAGGLLLACIVLVRNPFQAWFRFSYPNPGEIAVLQSAGFDATDDADELGKVAIRYPDATGGIVGADATGAPASAQARFISNCLRKVGLEEKATAWVFSVKPKRKVFGKDGLPKVKRQGRRNWNWYSLNSDGTKEGNYYLSKHDLYLFVSNGKDTASAKGGNRPSTFIATLEAIGEHGDAQRLLVAFIASLLLACAEWKRNTTSKRLRNVLVPAITLAAIAMSFKEGAFMAALLFTFFIFISLFWRKWWKLALLAVFLFSAAAATVSVPRVSSWLKSTGNALVMREYNKGGRLMMWMDIVPAVHAEHPYGTGFKGVTSSKMRSINRVVEPREHVHNVSLQVLLDFGYAGVATWLFWMLASLKSGLSLMRHDETAVAECGSNIHAALFRFPFAALCALLAVGVIEYNLPDSESVLMYSIAMGLACPSFRITDKGDGIAFLEKVFLCPRKGGGESLRGVELFNLNLVKDLVNAGHKVFFPVDKSWTATVGDFVGDSARLTLCTVPSLRHPILNCLAGAFAIRRHAKCNGRFKALFIANDVNGIIPSIVLLKDSNVFEKGIVFAHKLPSRAFINAVTDIPGHIIGVCESVAAPFRTSRTEAEVHADYGIAGGNAFFPAKKKDGSAGRVLKFCLVGGLDSAWKGADTAVSAFKLLPDDLKGRSELHLMAFRERKDFGDERIVCHNWLAPSEVANFLRTMDVMLAPSRMRESDGRLMETFSQVVVQGMLTSLPVIHTSIPVFTEKFDNGGGIQADTPAEFAQAMVELAADSNLRAKLGALGRKTALERYVWETSRFIKRYVE